MNRFIVYSKFKGDTGKFEFRSIQNKTQKNAILEYTDRLYPNGKPSNVIIGADIIFY